MRTIVHLSDIHFGRINAEVVQPLIASVRSLRPDAVVVSGDLTQRARRAEFLQARAFLDALPGPQVVVPGNHDIPLHDVLRRFFRPLKKYRRYITDDLTPLVADEEMMILGLNTARSLTVKSGRVNQKQIDRIEETFGAAPSSVTKILVTHHPFDVADVKGGDIVGRADRAMEMLSACGVDLLLSGHLHVGQTTHTALRYRTGGTSSLVVQAGTATSSRGRGETNSFNRLSINGNSVQIERVGWDPQKADFAPTSRETFTRSGSGWQTV
jgi:3',5'-cyclic AMP phosphodiesterase CpdA